MLSEIATKMLRSGNPLQMTTAVILVMDELYSALRDLQKKEHLSSKVLLGFAKQQLQIADALGFTVHSCRVTPLEASDPVSEQ